jgi:3-dehydroquinate synthetase/shikimate kinase
MPDGLVLVGLSGSGKSTFGRELARALGRPLLDTDAAVRERTGRTPAEIIRADGEAAFRTFEADVVASLPPGAVVATGGGAVEDPVNRWRLWQHGRVVWLDAAAELLAERLRAHDEPRPMLGSDLFGGLAKLAERRAAFYRAADDRVAADASLGDLAAAVCALLERRLPEGRRLFDAQVPRHHPMGPATARVVYGVAPPLPEVEGAPSVVVDRRVVSLAPNAPAGRRLAIAGGERGKRLRSLERILDWLSAVQHERGDPLVAVGGGTLGDLAGLAAALYGRGVPWMDIPTTWLAQADAALGGKVGVDLRAAKNAVGAFWPPVAVVGDLAALRTLPPSRLRDGLAEAIKAAIIGDPALWTLLESRGIAALRGDEEARYAITERSARVKLDIVSRDPFESGERRQLNLGHTLGHALEVESRYRLPHGAAVGLGLRAVAAIAVGRGLDSALADQLDALLIGLGFRLTHAFDEGRVREALGTDKKRHRGRQRWLLPAGIGQVEEVDDVSEAELARAIATVRG